MDKFRDRFLDSKLQPQLFSLLLVTIILIILSIVIYKKVKKQKKEEAPSGFLLITEQYVLGVDNLYKDVTGMKIKKPAPYIFTLITLLVFANLFGLLGFDPPSSSYSFTLTLALVSWIGIYVVGIMHHKLHFFRRYLNPIELIGQFAPLISLSFRLFGNMIGGVTILYMLYSFFGNIWSAIPVIGEINLLGASLTPFFHFYFDIFGGLIQAFVFTLLTMVYWTLETNEKEPTMEQGIEDAIHDIVEKRKENKKLLLKQKH